MGREFPGYKGGLKPEFRFLKDKAVIIQAWKKAHEYIRKHNWYSDNLELDASCIELNSLYEEIRDLFSSEKWQKYVTSPLRLVPAPKNKGGWTLDENKYLCPPLKGSEKIELRPLAHMTIKDQTIGVMFLMCLANIVETVQGQIVDTSSSEFPSNTVSYGNRLSCVWKNTNDKCNTAFFKWGNCKTYDAYYRDYEQFLKRPGKVIDCVREKAQKVGVEGTLYIVNLDLSKFYNHVRMAQLLGDIAKLVQTSGQYVDEKFLEALKHYLMSFRWDEKGASIAKNLDINEIGIPQGLVAGGFFANIALIRFDKQMQAAVGSCICNSKGCSISLVDYCRYVDDMRLVVSVRGAVAEQDRLICDAVNQFVAGRLEQYAKGQVLNAEKIHVTKASSVQASDFLSQQIGVLKHHASGPLDIHNAWKLLLLSKSLGDTAKANSYGSRTIAGIEISSNESVVKSATAERIRAYSWRKAYRKLANIGGNDIGEGFHTREELDGMTELFCDEMFNAWLEDPSNIRTLRVSFDLCPNEKYLQVVLLLMLKMYGDKNDRLILYAAYVLSEIYRAAAVETGFVFDQNQRHPRFDINAYRRCLLEFVPKILETRETIPWYLANQMALFIMVHGKNVDDRLLRHCDEMYRRCWGVVAGINADNAGDRTAVEIARRIRPDCSRIVRPTSVKPALQGSVSGTIAEIINDGNRVFTSEVAIVRLLGALVSKDFAGAFSRDNYLTPQRIMCKIENINALHDPTVEFHLDLTLDNDIPPERDSLYCPEPWENNTFTKLAQVGRIIRSVLVSDEDFSVMKRTQGDFITRYGDNVLQPRPYRGVRSVGLKRRYGLSFERRLLGEENPATSPWLMKVLSSLLAWPGSWCDDDIGILGMSRLRKLVRERLKLLKSYYGRASKQLMVPVDVDLSSFVSQTDKKKIAETLKTLNVAVVQNVFPHVADFKEDPCLDSNASRNRLRQHFANMRELLDVACTARDDASDGFKSINLVIFPEVSIHEDDLQEVERFADIKNSIVFCGLIFRDNPDSLGCLVNTGVWIIPQRREEDGSRSFIRLYQGKKYLTKEEGDLGISSYRPQQWIIRGMYKRSRKWSLTASMCYDSTDIKLLADLRDLVDCYIVSSYNKDIHVFDAMAESMRYHLFGHLIVANAAEFGGSTVQAPYKDPTKRVLMHVHGKDQAVVMLEKIHIADFKREKYGEQAAVKTPPAGYLGRMKHED